MRRNIPDKVLTDQQLEKELQRTMVKRRHLSLFKTMVSILLVAAALIVLITTLWFPIYQVTDKSTESHQKHEYIVAYKTKELSPEDIVAVYHHDQILLKRVVELLDGGYSVTDAQLESPPAAEANAVEWIDRDKVAGKVLFCIWPLQQAGYIG